MSSIEKRITAAILRTIRSHRDHAAPRDRECAPAGSVPPAKIREARFSDFDGVAALKQRWDLAADSIENWERLWQRNPALDKISEPPIGWVLEADGKIVGYLGNISQRFCFDDRTLTAVAAHAFVADAPYRAVSLSLAAAFFRQKHADLYISTSSIDAVGKMALAFGSNTVPQADYDTVLFWVVRPYAFAQSLMRKLEVGPALASIGSVFGSLAIGSDRFFRGRSPRWSGGSITISEVSPDAIGNDFQTLWAGKQNEKRRLFAERSPDSLRWHFEIPGDVGLVRLLCCHKDGRLQGYAVMRTDADPQNGLKKTIVADLIVLQDDPALTRALLGAAYKHAEYVGSHILELQGFPAEIRNSCADWLPYRRKFTACPYYYKAADPALHKELEGPELWYACPFDGDATLIRSSYSVSPKSSEESNTNFKPSLAVEVVEKQRAGAF